MKYTKDFKMGIVKKYLNGEYIPTFGDGSRHTCTKTIRKWARLYEYHGDEALGHRYNRFSIEHEDKASAMIVLADLFYIVKHTMR